MDVKQADGGEQKDLKQMEGYLVFSVHFSSLHTVQTTFSYTNNENLRQSAVYVPAKPYNTAVGKLSWIVVRQWCETHLQSR